MFITFEGIDFAGKSTQIALLRQFLEARGKTVHVVREPGGNTVSEAIRDVILDTKHNTMLPEAELLLYAASRVQLVKSDILPMLAAGDIVICDRYYDSTTAYQGYGRGLDLEFIHKLNTFASVANVPDFTFYIDVTVDESYKRRTAKAGHENDRLEAAGREFFERVRLGYLELAKSEPRFKKIAGEAPVEAIHEDIISHIKKAAI
jgi:dTMP kinase